MVSLYHNLCKRASNVNGDQDWDKYWIHLIFLNNRNSYKIYVSIKYCFWYSHIWTWEYQTKSMQRDYNLCNTANEWENLERGQCSFFAYFNPYIKLKSTPIISIISLVATSSVIKVMLISTTLYTGVSI